MFQSTMTVIVHLSLCFLMLSMLFFYWTKNKAMEIKKKEKQIMEYEKNAKIDIDDKYNKFASMSVKDLDEYLGHKFALSIELCLVSKVSDKDPYAKEKLYGEALAHFLEYLGAENIERIERYYGKNFVIKWAELNYRVLEIRGDISRMFSDKTIIGGL